MFELRLTLSVATFLRIVRSDGGSGGDASNDYRREDERCLLPLAELVGMKVTWDHLQVGRLRISCFSRLSETSIRL